MAIDRLLVAIGPADREHVNALIDVAIDIAGPAEAEVFLLHVFTNEEYDELVEGMDLDPTASVPPDELAARHESVGAATSRLEDADIAYDVRGVIGGKPGEQVIRLVAETDVDHVVVGGTRRSPAGKAVFGDHAQQILLNAPCPVTYLSRD